MPDYNAHLCNSFIDSTMDLSRLLNAQGQPDDVYDVQRAYLPWAPLAWFVMGVFGFLLSMGIERSLTSLTVAMAFLFAAAVGMFKLMAQSSFAEAAITRREMEAIQARRTHKNQRTERA